MRKPSSYLYPFAILAITSSLVLFHGRALAEDKAQPTGSPVEHAADNGQGERVNVENIKQKYWARGDESELGVVQNRLYSKANKLELSLLGGILSTDPFLSVKAL